MEGLTEPEPDITIGLVAIITVYLSSESFGFGDESYPSQIQ